MSLVIFFGFAAFIFVLGIVMILATIRGWKKEAEMAKAEIKAEALKAERAQAEAINIETSRLQSTEILTEKRT